MEIYDGKLKAFIDKVMRVYSMKYLAPGVTIAFQKEADLLTLIGHLAKKFPQGNFGALVHRQGIRDRLGPKLLRAKKGASATPVILI